MSSKADDIAMRERWGAALAEYRKNGGAPSLTEFSLYFADSEVNASHAALVTELHRLRAEASGYDDWQGVARIDDVLDFLGVDHAIDFSPIGFGGSILDVIVPAPPTTASADECSLCPDSGMCGHCGRQQVGRL